MTIFKKIFLAFSITTLSIFSITNVAKADESNTSQVSEKTTPIGFWQTIDDESGKPRSIVKIFPYQGKIYGRIMQVNYEDDESPQDVCAECKGARKNAPILGMVIISGMVKKSDATNEWHN